MLHAPDQKSLLERKSKRWRGMNSQGSCGFVSESLLRNQSEHRFMVSTAILEFSASCSTNPNTDCSSNRKRAFCIRGRDGNTQRAAQMTHPWAEGNRRSHRKREMLEQFCRNVPQFIRLWPRPDWLLLPSLHSSGLKCSE